MAIHGKRPEILLEIYELAIMFDDWLVKQYGNVKDVSNYINQWLDEIIPYFSAEIAPEEVIEAYHTLKGE